MTLELRGFSADRGRFLLTAAACKNDGTRRILEREMADLQSWDRQLHRSSTSKKCQRLPTKRLRKLTASNWVRGDRGWRVELLKNVTTCEAWINAAFAMLPTQQQQEFLDDELYAAAKHKRAVARAHSKHARDLQQYFTSAELVDLVVERTMAHLQQQEQSEVVWLEPSCGDGRFLTALLRAGARNIVGYEIDERLHEIAEKSVQEAATCTSTTGPSDDSCVRAQVCLGDFLASKSSVPTDKFVVAVGNPPFGAKGGDGSDLVHFFFRHAAREWKARVVAFIVPERCSRAAFVETTLQQLHGPSWKLATELPLTDHQFEFGVGDNIKRIRQPSVLQIFVRGLR